MFILHYTVYSVLRIKQYWIKTIKNKYNIYIKYTVMYMYKYIVYLVFCIFDENFLIFLSSISFTT